MSKINWVYKDFDALTNQELYDLLAVRIEVFVVEQNCPYQDVDGKDQKAHHLIGYAENGEVAGYARITFPGVRFKEVSIGRVVTSQKYRRKGFGKLLMEESLKKIKQDYGTVPVRISAQSYLIPFYSSFGFEPLGEEYLEDGILHTEMLRP